MAVGRSSITGITSPPKIIANIFISFIGAGLLGLPYAFKESGVLEGTVIMSIVGYLSVMAMLMLIDCKYAILASGGRSGGRTITMESKVPLISPESSEEEEFDRQRNSKHNFTSSDLTYGDIGLYSFGSPGKRLVDITIVISQIGFCCGYLIYLCENLRKHLDGLTQGQWLILLLPPIYGLTLLRHLNKLAIFSLFAQVSNVFALAVVFWFDFSHSEEVPFHPKEVSIKGFPFFFAVSIYCYEGAGMILSLEESVAQQKKKMFRPIFVSTMIALTILYITFGASGYLSFGPHTQQIITLNLPHGNSSVDFAAIVKICLGVSFFFTYPMMLFPVTHLADKTFGFQNDKTKGNLLRLVLVLLTGIVVIAIPSFAVLASLIGATCCTLLAFIMPAAFHIAIFKNRLTKKQYYFDVCLIVLGILGTAIGLWDTLHRITERPHRVDELAQNHVKGTSFVTPSALTFQNVTDAFNSAEKIVGTLKTKTTEEKDFLTPSNIDTRIGVSEREQIKSIVGFDSQNYSSSKGTEALLPNNNNSINSTTVREVDSKKGNQTMNKFSESNLDRKSTVAYPDLNLTFLNSSKISSKRTPKPVPQMVKVKTD